MTALADLPAAALEQLAPSNLPRTCRRGQVLGNEGDPGESISILKKGQLRVTQWTTAGDEAVQAFDLARSQGELAAEIGAARPTLDRALRGFEEQGIIATGGPRVTILDQNRLAAFTN